MASRGRPTLCTPETTRKATDALRLQAPYWLAARYAGIGESTFMAWMARGRADTEADIDSPYRDFLEEVHNASSQGAIGELAMIEKAAKDGEWRAAAWKLERRYPEDFGRRPQALIPNGARVSAGTDEEARVSLNSLTDAELVQLDAMTKRLRLPGMGETNGSSVSSGSSGETTSPL